jgi:type I pantothenate kinase
MARGQARRAREADDLRVEEAVAKGKLKPQGGNKAKAPKKTPAKKSPSRAMHLNFANLYEKFSRRQWAKLRANMPLEISHEDLDELRGLNDPVSLDEVEAIYLPLGRLLNIHIGSALGRGQVKDAFLGRPSPRPTYVIAVTGSVAVGKSTFSRVLAQVLSRWQNHPSVELVTTDGFLLPNKILAERGLADRKGFPESYDLRQMLDFMIALRQGARTLKVPVYSHDSYDILPGEFLEIRRPEILILEGLNLLQLNLLGEARSPKLLAGDLIDFSIYVDAEEENIRRWYMERFMLLKNTAFRNPRSFFHRFAAMNDHEAREFATEVWQRINLVNLLNNVAPTRERAQVVMQKGRDHRVREVWLRRV